MENKIVTFRINKDFHLHLIKESHRLSLDRDEDLNVSDLIREAIMEKYPFETSSKFGGNENGEEGK